MTDTPEELDFSKRSRTSLSSRQNAPAPQEELPRWPHLGDVSSSSYSGGKRWLNREDAGTYLGVHPRTLANWAAKGQGPRYSKPSGNSCMYRRTDLDAYLEAHMVHTDEQHEAA